MHNILTLTGDKPDNGDHPFAQSVFEVDCMGLLNIAKTLNAGKDLAGNDLDAPTNFYIGATGNPGALDLEIERQKGGKEAGTEIAIETLEQIKKMAAGVHIMPLNDIDTTLYIIDHV